MLLADETPAPALVEPEVKDCSSCTARHKSLQALQKARLTPPPPQDQPEDPTDADAKDD
jgi:hypothetical protein